VTPFASGHEGRFAAEELRLIKHRALAKDVFLSWRYDLAMELHAEIISTGAPSASAYRDISRPSSPETDAREKYESRQQPGRAVLITGRIQPFALNSLPLP
jgi:hypothetical protein